METENSKFTVTIDGDALSFDFDSIRAREAMDLEAVTGQTMTQWSTSLQSGSITALIGLVYLMKKRANPTIKFADVDFELAELKVDSESEDAPEVPTEAGAEA